MKAIGIITTVLITLIIAPIWRGYAFSKLWLWFIVSTFGAAPLAVAQSIGLALVGRAVGDTTILKLPANIRRLKITSLKTIHKT